MFNPKFSITSQMLRALNRIEVIREKIASCPIHPKEEYRLKRETILSIVRHSTAIEGNTLNEFEKYRKCSPAARSKLRTEKYMK